MTKTIVVHDGSFHSDDALAVFFVRHLCGFADSRVIRTRDESVILGADIVCDVGRIFDEDKLRFDHHQSGCQEHYMNCKIPLSSCGMVYRKFQEEINGSILKENGRSAGSYMKYICENMYFGFVQEIDAVDNGVEQYSNEDVPVYQLRTTISNRIRMMNDSADFEDAVQLIGKEYVNKLLLIVDSEIPSIDLAKKAFENRFNVDKSGKIVLFDVLCKSEFHLKNLEKENGLDDDKQLLYIINPRIDGNWMVYAIGTGKPFELRKPLPFKGLRDEELSKNCGIPGGVFVHKSGFLAAFNKKEQAIQFAKLALESK